MDVTELTFTLNIGWENGSSLRLMFFNDRIAGRMYHPAHMTLTIGELGRFTLRLSNLPNILPGETE